mmetsp:Transcript_44451/g.141516  ORF Transcript_44451/g.141516 Transcript_44451/m.141516 type:complete len:212 (+) Transcript_44451:539-1174(+)
MSSLSVAAWARSRLLRFTRLTRSTEPLGERREMPSTTLVFSQSSRYMVSPSRSQTIGLVVSRPAAVRVSDHPGSHRSAPTAVYELARYLTLACSAMSLLFTSSTSLLSTSNQRTPPGSGRRHARESIPAPSSTTCRGRRAPGAPALKAARSASSKYLVRTAMRLTPGAFAMRARDRSSASSPANTLARGSTNMASGRSDSTAREAAIMRDE